MGSLFSMEPDSVFEDARPINAVGNPLGSELAANVVGERDSQAVESQFDLSVAFGWPADTPGVIDLVMIKGYPV